MEMLRGKCWDEDGMGMHWGWGCTGDKMLQDEDGMGTGTGMSTSSCHKRLSPAEAGPRETLES